MIFTIQLNTDDPGVGEVFARLGRAFSPETKGVSNVAKVVRKANASTEVPGGEPVEEVGTPAPLLPKPEVVVTPVVTPVALSPVPGVTEGELKQLVSTYHARFGLVQFKARLAVEGAKRVSELTPDKQAVFYAARMAELAAPAPGL